MNYDLQAKRTQNWSIHSEPWPQYDPKLAQAKTVTLVIQINGKLRDQLLIEAGTGQSEVEKLALALPKVQKYLENKNPRKTIFIVDRLINFVV